MQRILATTSIPPPAANGIQHQSNKVGNAIVVLNKNDMKDLRKNIKHMNEVKGLSQIQQYGLELTQNTIQNSVQPKVRLNFNLVHRQTQHLVEHNSGQNKVTGVHVTSRTCVLCSRPHKGSEEITEHEGQCSANVFLTVLGMYMQPRRTMKDLIADGDGIVMLCYVTSDGESGS